MYRELLDANKGVNYFLLSTDEPYYVGLANNSQCNEADEAKRSGGVGKVLAQFVSKAAAYLHAHGRTVIFWGEYPLKVADIPGLPSYLINGEVYGAEFDRAFRAHGIRQMIYTYAQASDRVRSRSGIASRFSHQSAAQPRAAGRHSNLVQELVSTRVRGEWPPVSSCAE
jgi:hypothetical protein